MTSSTRQQSLRIAILGKSNHIGGGASKVSELMAESLTALGHAVDRFTVLPTSGVDPGGQALFGQRISAAVGLVHWAGRRFLGGEFFPLELAALHDWPSRYDLVHVNDHFLSVSPWTIAWLADRIPTALTLNDASYFTGGCLYPFECNRFELGCGQCPQRAAMGMVLDLTRPSLELKTHILGGKRKLTLHAPSEWMADEAARAPMIGARPVVIPYGIRRHLFHPGRREAAREKLGIGVDEKVVLIGASSLMDPRKNAAMAVNAINLLPEPRPTALLLGLAGDSVKASLQTRSIPAGFIEDDEPLADVYAAADLFAFPSLADNLPLSVIESLSCGTPVICFDRGGTPELIRSERDGEVLTEISAEQLSRAMGEWLERMPADPEQRRAIAEATECFSLHHYGSALSALYSEMLDARHREF